MNAGEHRLALPAGFRLEKYSVLSVLGAGGFGITYLAEDASLGRRVAIKELLPNEIATRVDGSTVVAKTKSEEENLAWARDRFVKEGRALAACDHPNVVNVYEMIEANGTAYMVTKFEQGRSFSEWLKEIGGAPTEKELRAILLPLLSGLEKVHKSGFLHRDLKPENIYLTDDGRPILLDFGSARQAVGDRTTSLTSIVTSGYAPFEQYHEDGKQGAWSDLYALAAVLFRAIHGKKPPEATRRLKDDPCPKLAKFYAGKYSPQFLSAIDRALAVEPQKRPQSVSGWLEMLGEAPAEEKTVIPPWWAPWLTKLQQAVLLAKAKPLWAGGAGAALLALILALSVHKKVVPPVPIPGPTASASAFAYVSPPPSASPSASASGRDKTIVIPPRNDSVPTSTDLNTMIANAAPGATIKVAPGVYPGGLILSKAVHLVGQGGQTMIQSEGKEAITVKSAGVALEGIQVFSNGIGELPAISVADGASLEMDGCKIQSGSKLGVALKGNASIKAVGSTFASANGTAMRLNGGRANLTQCVFVDSYIGLAAGNGAEAELHSCAFERDGGSDMSGAGIVAIGTKTKVTADDCHFTENYAGLGTNDGASLTITNSSFKNNVQGARASNATGLILVRTRAHAKLENDRFERNGEGIFVREGGSAELQKCQFESNGTRSSRDVIPATLPLAIINQNSSASVRNSVFMSSASYAVNVADGGALQLEDSEISGSGSVGLVVGQRSAPGHAEIKRSHFLGNATGIAIFAGSSATIEDSECRENRDGMIVIDPQTQVKMTKVKLLTNREFGLYVHTGAQVTATDCDIQDNNKGVQSGTARKSSDRASLTLENCRFGRNRTFAAGACTQSELNLNGCTFDGSDKTNIYKERGAIVQTDGVSDNSSQASSDNSSNQGQSQQKKPTRPRRPNNDEIYQMIRRFHP